MDEGNRIVVHVRQTKALSVKASGGPHKIVQTRSEFGMVVRLETQLVTISYKVCLPLAVVEATAAQCLKKLQLAVSRVG